MSTPADTMPRNPLPADASLYGGFWRRLFALLIDSVIVTVGFYLLETLTGLLIPDFSLTSFGMICIQLLSLLWTWLYFAVTNSSTAQASPGKRLLGLKVTDLNGHRITFGRATGRYFAETLSALLLFIGYLMVLFTARRQCLHDLIANTLVPRRAVEPVAGTRPSDTIPMSGGQIALSAAGFAVSVLLGIAIAVYLPTYLS
jgi:uncharacterized RDD family membrane protein YckC